MHLVEVVETLGGQDCMRITMTALIKIVNKSMSRLRNVNYPMTLSPEAKLCIQIMY